MQYQLKSPKSGTVYTVDTPRERVQLLSAGYIEVTEQQSTPKRDSRPGTKSSQSVTPPQPAPPTEDESA